MTRSSRGEGLSLAYRLGYRLRLAALSLLGPAELESRRLMVESFNRADMKEGVQSFLEKRPPSFERLGS